MGIKDRHEFGKNFKHLEEISGWMAARAVRNEAGG